MMPDQPITYEAIAALLVRISKFEHGGRVHELREAVPFNIEFAEGVWAYSNDSLGLRGFAFKRDDALRELHEAFDFVYQDIALEADNALDEKAIEIKRRFLDLL